MKTLIFNIDKAHESGERRRPKRYFVENYFEVKSCEIDMWKSTAIVQVKKIPERFRMPNFITLDAREC